MSEESAEEGENAMILVSNIPPETTEDGLIIHFQRRKNGGCGDVVEVKMLAEGKAIVTVESTQVAESILNHDPHVVNEGRLKLEPYIIEEEKSADQIEVFSKVTVSLEEDALQSVPDVLTMMNELSTETGVEWHSACFGTLVTGTFEQVIAFRELLQRYIASLTLQSVQTGAVVKGTDHEMKLKEPKPQISRDFAGNNRSGDTNIRNTSSSNREKRASSESVVDLATPKMKYRRDDDVVQDSIGKDSSSTRDEQASSESDELQVVPCVMELMTAFYTSDLQRIKGYGVDILWSPNNPEKVILVGLQGINAVNVERGKEEFYAFYQKMYQKVTTKDFNADNLNISTEIFHEAIGNCIAEGLKISLKTENQRRIHLTGERETLQRAAEIIESTARKFASSGSSLVGSQSSPSVIPSQQRSLHEFEHFLPEGLKIKLVQGDITKEKVDVIVNPANRFLDHGGGVAGAIVKVGGFVIQRESSNLLRRRGNSLDVGDAVYTKSGKLPCSLVIHVVGPVWKEHTPQEVSRLLRKAVKTLWTLHMKKVISPLLYLPSARERLVCPCKRAQEYCLKPWRSSVGMLAR